MPEEAIETQELKERLDEAREHAHGRPWLTWLSLSTAILAVLAALSSLESGSFANNAIVQKNDAVLHQSLADDAWAYFQAKGVQATLYSTQAQVTANATLAAEWRGNAERERLERAEIKKVAEEEQRAVAEQNEKSAHSLHVHHEFAKSVTIFQVAIALSAIAALTRKQPAWWVSLAIGVGGAIFFVMGMLSR